MKLILMMLGITSYMVFAQTPTLECGPEEYNPVELEQQDSGPVYFIEVDEEDDIMYIDYDNFIQDDLSIGNVYFDDNGGIYMYFGKRN